MSSTASIKLDGVDGPDHSKESIQADASSSPQDNVQAPADVTDPDKPPRDIYGFRWFLVCVSLYVGALIYGLDTTIAADIQATIIEDFGDVSQLTWVGTGFPLGSVSAILPCAAFYAVYDVKILFLGSIILFEVGSAVCGSAPTMNALIVGRVLAGVGGSGVYIGILNYISQCTSGKERGRYMSGIGLVWGMGAILGPVVGGAFSTSAATWRWAFYINLVIAAICAPVYIFYLPSIKPLGENNKTAWKQFLAMDWFGFLFSTGALVCFVAVLTFGGTTWAWSDGRTITLFVVFGVLLIVTAVQQKFIFFTTRAARMVPPSHITGNRSQVLLNIQTAATVTNIFIPLYYIPLYFQFVQGDSSIMAAVRLLPFILILVTTNIISGFSLPWIGYYWAMYAVTGVLMTVGGALMYTVTITSSAANIYGYSVLLAIGAGLTFQSGYAIAGVKAAQKGWSATDIQAAVSLINVSQIGGTLMSLLICGQVFQSLASRNLSAALAGGGFTDAEIRGGVGGIHSLLFERLNGDQQARASYAITEGMRNVYILSMTAGVLSLVCSMLMKKERLFGVEAGIGGGS